MLNMQVATQVMESLKKPITLDSASHTGIGMDLTHAGAELMINNMEFQLRKDGLAYVHVGDDSFVVKHLPRDRLLLYALDCSSFDLTQHADMTAVVHQVMREHLRRIDVVAAELWYAMVRKRMVVLMGTLVYIMRHAGPSGMPLQSMTNDILWISSSAAPTPRCRSSWPPPMGRSVRSSWIRC